MKVTALLIWLPVEQSRSVGEQKRRSTKSNVLFSDECLQVVDLHVVKNHGDQWPHQACIIEVDTKKKLTMIKWETT